MNMCRWRTLVSRLCIFSCDDFFFFLTQASVGLTADARVLIQMAQTECQSHRLTVEDPVSIDYISRYIARIQQKYTQQGGVRPFGISTLVVGHDADKSPRLYHTDPAGMFSEWKVLGVFTSTGIFFFSDSDCKKRRMRLDDRPKRSESSLRNSTSQIYRERMP